MLEDTVVAGVKRVRNVTVDPLETLKRRELITESQYVAGQRFAKIFRKAMLVEIYATVKFGHISATPNDQMIESVVKAKAEVRSVLKHLGYPLASLAEHVIGNCHAIRSWKAGKGSVETLRLVLNGLKNYYKM